jgi:hypothetical protein
LRKSGRVSVTLSNSVLFNVSIGNWEIMEAAVEKAVMFVATPFLELRVE